MIYLDYSATTMPNDMVLDVFNKVSKEYIGNVNSLHKLGVASRELLNYSITEVASFFSVMENEIIFTSGATESNNLAIKGVMDFYNNRGNHIITSKLEHSSVIEAANNYDVSYINIMDNGLIDIDHLKSLIKKGTVLVSISLVDSEIGIKQNVNEIGRIVKGINKNIIFHVDITQGVGKIDIDLEHVDLASMSAHKFYGLKGVGLLYKKSSISLKKLFDGGKSQSLVRSGTPALPLIVSFVKALKIAYENNSYEHILKLNKKIKDHFKKYEDVIINSTENSIPHILNFSMMKVKPETFMNALASDDIYISTKSACSKASLKSEAVYVLTKDNEKSISSLRISLSYLTTEEQIDKFLEVFDNKYKEVRI